MLATLRARLTFANVCSFLALLIALGTGSAYAANTVFSEDIVNGEVKAADLGNNSVRSTKIGNAQVLNQDLAGNSVDSPQILSDAVGPTEVADNSIDSGEIANETLLASDLASSAVGTSEIQSGAVGNTDLASSAVDGSKVSNNSLTTADIEGTDVNGSISLGAGSVPNGRCEQFNSSNGGAEEDQGVMLVTRGALQQGVMISAQRVPSDGNVTVNVCNFSGTTQAAITNLPVRVITFG